MKNKLLLLALLVPMSAISSGEIGMDDKTIYKNLLNLTVTALYLPAVYWGSKFAANFSEAYKQVANGEADVAPEQMSECEEIEGRFRSLFPGRLQNSSTCARAQKSFDETSKNVPLKCERTAHKALLVMAGLGPQERLKKAMETMKRQIKKKTSAA